MSKTTLALLAVAAVLVQADYRKVVGKALTQPFEAHAHFWSWLANTNLSALLHSDRVSVNCSASIPAATEMYMIDATGKAPAGILYGNVYSLGSYEECTQIPDVPGYPRPDVCGLDFDGLTWGVCFPPACVADLQAFVESTLKTSVAVSCASGYGYTAGAIACIIICSVFFALVVISTLVDEIKPIYLALVTPKRPSSKNINNEEDEALIDMNPTKATVVVERFPSKLLACFSLSRNIPKIFNMKTSSDSIHCLDGMRVLSMMWVMFGHNYFWTFSYPTDNLLTYSSYIKDASFQIIANGFFSVDSFFFISGFLVAYGIFKALTKDPKFPWVHYYVHRYLRLTPIYGFVFLFYSELLAYTANGPLWSLTGVSTPCNLWWQNLLYIQNFNADDGCMAWAWYLAIDMQLYIIAPLFILPLFYFPKIGVAINIIFIVALTMISFGIAYDSHIKANLFAGLFGSPLPDYGTPNYNSYVYLKPWFRAGPFLVGILAAYIVKQLRWKINIRQRVDVVVGGWALCFAALYLIQFGLSGEFGADAVGGPLTRFGNAVYIATSRLGWGVALAWITVACIRGFGGPANTLLSAPFWIPLSRINYAAYLVHPLLFNLVFQSEQVPFHVTGTTLPFLYLSVVFATYLCAAVLVAFVEAPLAQLEKLLLG